MKNLLSKLNTPLNRKIAIYVPATVLDKPIDNTLYVERVARVLSQCFGGSTAMKANGYYESDSLGLIKEQTTYVFSHCNDEQLEIYANTIFNLISDLLNELSQECIALEINSDMYFLDTAAVQGSFLIA